MHDRITVLNRRSIFFVIIVLTTIILSAYWPVQNHEFINYDDPSYVTDNYLIQNGITFGSIKSAFSDMSTSNWHPLTMMSHMLDWQLFGNRAGGHHWTNVIIHILNTILLFVLLNKLTGTLWRSAFVAALFAVHPLNVESVAWVSERKNVLSTFFLLLTVLFYVRYVNKPDWKRYLPVFLCFALGLMSKPMLVTLPFALLLLDYWPLNRLQMHLQDNDYPGIKELIRINGNKILNLVAEKAPLFVLSVISSYFTIYASQYVNDIGDTEMFPLPKRFSNAVVSYVLYIKKFFLPTDLSVFYPISDIPMWQFIIALFLLIGITVYVCRYFTKYPYLLVGWLWYLGTLVPVIGLMQVGSQAMADRYAYVPLIGLFIMVVWGISQILLRLKDGPIIAVSIATASILAMTLATHMQVGTWKNNFTLFGHALSVDHQNYQAYSLLGLAMAERGDYEKSIYYEYMSLKYNPKFHPAYNYAGIIFEKMGKLDEAIHCYKKALQINDKSSEANYNLGIVLMEKNNLDEAIVHFNKALHITPYDSDVHNNLGVALMKKGNVRKAFAHFQEALLLNPQGESAQINIKIAIAEQKKYIKKKSASQ